MFAESHRRSARTMTDTGKPHLPGRFTGDAVEVRIGGVYLGLAGEGRRHGQARPEVHAHCKLTVDADVEAELTTFANSEVGHHLWVSPDRPSGLQGERLVDGQMVDERACGLQCLEPGGIRSRRVDHDVRAVLEVLAKVAVHVVHE